MALVDSKHQSNVNKMKKMLNDDSCSEPTFVLDIGARVHALKKVLIDRNEYFRAMFRSNMRESRENEVHVRDRSKGAFLLFLESLYCSLLDVRGMVVDETLVEL